MNGKILRVNDDIYSDIDNIRKKLVEKAGLHKNLSMRETMEIIWKMNKDTGMGLEETIRKIRENNIKIAWGTRGRRSKKHRSGQMNIAMA